MQVTQLRRLVKTHCHDYQQSSIQIYKKDCLQLLKPKIDDWFRTLLENNEISNETERTQAMELMRSKYLNMQEWASHSWRWRVWNQPAEPSDPHNDQPTRGKQLRKQLYDYFLEHHAYPKYTRTNRQNWQGLNNSEKFLILTNRRMRARYLRLCKETCLSQSDKTFLEDVKSLPCWTHTHPGSEPYVPGASIGNETALAQWGDSMEVACQICVCFVDKNLHAYLILKNIADRNMRTIVNIASVVSTLPEKMVGLHYVCRPSGQ